MTSGKDGSFGFVLMVSWRAIKALRNVGLTYYSGQSGNKAFAALIAPSSAAGVLKLEFVFSELFP